MQSELDAMVDDPLVLGYLEAPKSPPARCLQAVAEALAQAVDDSP